MTIVYLCQGAQQEHAVAEGLASRQLHLSGDERDRRDREALQPRRRRRRAHHYLHLRHTTKKRGGRDTTVLAFECQRIPMEVVSDGRRVSGIGEHLRRSLHSVVGEAGPSTMVVAAPGLSNFSASPWGRSLTTGGHFQATVSLACDVSEGWSLLLLCPTGRNTIPQT